jgi:trigger factor
MESCKRSLEITISPAEVEAETGRIVAELQKKVRLPGFRPGKVPLELIRKRYASDIRQNVLESIVPKHFRARVESDHLHVVGTPDIVDVHFVAGEPLRFKAEFEVAPEIELKDYRNLTVSYRDPEVIDEDIGKRIEELRNQHATYINVDPRPAEDGDWVAVSLESISGLEGDPIRQDELVFHVGGPDTLPEFTENLRGMQPDDQKEFDVTYPQEYGQPRLAGKAVRFRARLKAIRRKEMPDLNDEFAHDLGDYQTLDELRDAVRKAIYREREFAAQQQAKDKLVAQLAEMHEFPVPETYIDRQLESQVAEGLLARGVDPRSVKINWDEVKKNNRDRAVRDVKATLLLDRIATREGIEPTTDEVDREVQRIARQEREPVAAVRMRLEKNGTLARIASRIRTEKTLSFLFESARKVAED